VTATALAAPPAVRPAITLTQVKFTGGGDSTVLSDDGDPYFTGWNKGSKIIKPSRMAASTRVAMRSGHSPTRIGMAASKTKPGPNPWISSGSLGFCQRLL
jgi:hypothetical protein